MQIKSTEKLPDILSACSDGVTVYLFVDWHPSVMLAIMDSSTFKITNRFTLQLPFNRLIQPCVDENCVYIPTTEGHVIGVNKFDGTVLVTADMGLMTLVADIEQDSDYLYTLCGVPIGNGLKTDTKTFVICVNSKEDGKKVFQSQSMTGQICPITVQDDIWALVDKKLYHYSTFCELKSTANLNFFPHYKPLVTEDFVAVASNVGTLEIFKRNGLAVHGKMITEKNASPPVAVSDNQLVWFADKQIYKINLAALEMQKIATLPARVLSTPAIVGTSIFVSDELGNIVKLDSEHNVEKISVDKVPTRKPLQADSFVVTSTKEKVHFIEV